MLNEYVTHASFNFADLWKTGYNFCGYYVKPSFSFFKLNGLLKYFHNRFFIKNPAFYFPPGETSLQTIKQLNNLAIKQFSN